MPLSDFGKGGTNTFKSFCPLFIKLYADVGLFMKMQYGSFIYCSRGAKEQKVSFNHEQVVSLAIFS